MDFSTTRCAAVDGGSTAAVTAVKEEAREQPLLPSPLLQPQRKCPAILSIKPVVNQVVETVNNLYYYPEAALPSPAHQQPNFPWLPAPWYDQNAVIDQPPQPVDSFIPQPPYYSINYDGAIDFSKRGNDNNNLPFSIPQISLPSTNNGTDSSDALQPMEDGRFPCCYCSVLKTFSSRRQLRQHEIKYHIDQLPVVPVQCDLCSRRFISQASLRRHQKKCGNNNTNNPATADVFPRQKRPKTADIMTPIATPDDFDEGGERNISNPSASPLTMMMIAFPTPVPAFSTALNDGDEQQQQQSSTPVTCQLCDTEFENRRLLQLHEIAFHAAFEGDESIMAANEAMAMLL